MNRKRFLSILISIILMVVILILLSPFIISDRRIRDCILHVTPIGTSMDDVLAVIENNDKWRVMSKSNEQGYVNFSYSPGERIVGEKHIIANLGTIGFFWYISSSWGFDENGILIDVYVDKASNQ